MNPELRPWIVGGINRQLGIQQDFPHKCGLRSVTAVERGRCLDREVAGARFVVEGIFSQENLPAGGAPDAR